MRSAQWFSSASSRGFGLFIRPPFKHATTAWAFLLALVALISVADYLIGIQLSLSIFYLIPISLAAGWLGTRSGIAISLVCTVLRLVGDVATVSPNYLPGFVWWNSCAATITFFLVVWLIDTLVTAHRGLESRVAARTTELADAIAERRRLELEVIDVASRERAAIGRELHDELGQHLVATALAAQVLAQQLGVERGGREAQAIVGWIEQAIAKTRKLARGLLVARIEADRLPTELEELASNASQGGVKCRVTLQGDKLAASAPECAQLFRIAQESIGNALRHARPRAIEVTLATDAEASCLIITDDGQGFDPATAPTGMGLRIMEYRAQMIGASLAVLSSPGEGTKVICRLPVPPNPTST